MTPAPEKAAPIPAEVRRHVKKLWVEHGGFQYGPRVEHYAIIEDAFWQFMAAILADREARPSLPYSREEWIREDEPGYLVRIAFREGRSGGLRITSPDVPGLILSHHDEPAILADMIEVLREADRARARQGGNNG